MNRCDLSGNNFGLLHFVQTVSVNYIMCHIPNFQTAKIYDVFRFIQSKTELEQHCENHTKDDENVIKLELLNHFPSMQK